MRGIHFKVIVKVSAHFLRRIHQCIDLIFRCGREVPPQHTGLDLGCQFELGSRLFLFSGHLHILSGISIDLLYHRRDIIGQQSEFIAQFYILHFSDHHISVFGFDIM